jgi:hypothetical protein
MLLSDKISATATFLKSIKTRIKKKCPFDSGHSSLIDFHSYLIKSKSVCYTVHMFSLSEISEKRALILQGHKTSDLHLISRILIREV